MWGEVKNTPREMIPLVVGALCVVGVMYFYLFQRPIWDSVWMYSR